MKLSPAPIPVNYQIFPPLHFILTIWTWECGTIYSQCGIFSKIFWKHCKRSFFEIIFHISLSSPLPTAQLWWRWIRGGPGIFVRSRRSPRTLECLHLFVMLSLVRLRLARRLCKICIFWFPNGCAWHFIIYELDINYQKCRQGALVDDLKKKLLMFFFCLNPFFTACPRRPSIAVPESVT